MGIISKIDSFISTVITRLVGLLEYFLFLRFLLKFLGANPQALIVDLIYKYSGILVSPFKFIFSNIYWRGHLIETSTIVAMMGYYVAVLVLLGIIHLFSRD